MLAKLWSRKRGQAAAQLPIAVLVNGSRFAAQSPELGDRVGGGSG